MLRLKKILCPTDFSEPSYEGLKAANELGVLFSAELWLVHVIGPMPTPSTPAPAPAPFDIGAYEGELEQAARQDLDKLIEEKFARELKARAVVAHGDAANEILRIAGEEDVDVIVMSTHGRTGWRHMVFGSVAERVVRLSPCPVLTIPAPREE
jgi:nucleotide-binding universal stress UspA family protein